MNLYVIRHGETKANAQGIYDGNLNEDINETGITQTKQTKELMKDKNCDLIYCSPMLRAKHTCEIINDKNKPVIYDDRLKERTLGKLDGTNLEENNFSKKDLFDYTYKANDKKFEDLQSLFNRVHEFLNEIIEKNKKRVFLL